MYAFDKTMFEEGKKAGRAFYANGKRSADDCVAKTDAQCFWWSAGFDIGRDDARQEELDTLDEQYRDGE